MSAAVLDATAVLAMLHAGPDTRRVGLSPADRACLALASRLRLPAITADRSWLRVDLGIELRPIR